MDLQFLSRWRIWNPGPVVSDADVEVVILWQRKNIYVFEMLNKGTRKLFGLPMDRSNKYPNMVIAVTYVCTSVVDI